MTEMVERPTMATATSLPQELLDHLNQRGLIPSFRRVDEMTRHRWQMSGVEPFNVESIKEDEALYDLIVRACYPNPEGQIVRADATLCVQSFERREEELLLMQKKKNLMESGGRAKEAIEEELRRELGDAAIPITGEISEGYEEIPVDAITGRELIDLPGRRR